MLHCAERRMTQTFATRSLDPDPSLSLDPCSLVPRFYPNQLAISLGRFEVGPRLTVHSGRELRNAWPYRLEMMRRSSTATTPRSVPLLMRRPKPCLNLRIAWGTEYWLNESSK